MAQGLPPDRMPRPSNINSRNGKTGLAPAPQGPTGLGPDLMELFNGWPERFRTKIKISAGCWEWTASLDARGYGRFGRGGRRAGVAPAHRYAYELAFGTVPAELVIDHLCRRPCCVRPDHLEAVTHGENVRRGQATNVSGWCRSGRHLWIEANIVRESDSRRCRPCRDERELRTRPPKGNAPGDRTHCPQGHPYDEKNTRVKANGSRDCKTCHRDQMRLAYQVRAWR